MKKIGMILTIVTLMFGLFACAGKPAETTAPFETTAPVETTVPPTTVPPTTVPPETTLPPDDHLTSQGFAPLEQLIAGSDITVAVEDEQIVMTEDGLVLELDTGSCLVRRDGCVVALLREEPQVFQGAAYVHKNDFLK